MFYSGIPADPMSLGGNDNGHDTESASTGGHDFVAIRRRCIAALSGETADRMSEIPEIFECLFLYQVEQGAVGNWLAVAVEAADGEPSI